MNGGGVYDVSRGLGRGGERRGLRFCIACVHALFVGAA